MNLERLFLGSLNKELEEITVCVQMIRILAPELWMVPRVAAFLTPNIMELQRMAGEG